MVNWSRVKRFQPKNKLIKQFGVSQITIRNALANLEREGLIVRSRAKGTFVAEGYPYEKEICDHKRSLQYLGRCGSI